MPPISAGWSVTVTITPLMSAMSSVTTFPSTSRPLTITDDARQVVHGGSVGVLGLKLSV